MPREGLVAAIAANAQDLEVQGVHADHLIDRGGDAALRGELIHVARALAAAPSRAKRATLGARETELVTAITRAYRRLGITGLAIEGGFARTWRCKPALFVTHAATLFATEPLLHELVVVLDSTDGVAQAREISEVPELADVTHLAINGSRSTAGRPTATGLAGLLASPHWPSLVSLKLPLCGLGTDGALLLAQATSLARLTELDIFQNAIQPAGIVALARSPHLAQLTRLRLEGNRVGEEGVQALATTTHLTRLTWINTRDTWLTRMSIQPIVERFPGASEHGPY